MPPPIYICRRDEYLQRGITGSRTHASKTCVHSYGAALHSDYTIRNPERQIVVRMYAALCFRTQYPVISLEPGGAAFHSKGAPAIGNVDAVRAIIFHELGLLRE